MKVKLDDVLEALEFANSETEYFYHKETGEVVMHMDSSLTGIDDTELMEDIEENWGNYISLPGQFDINEYHMMEKFIWDLPEGKVQDRLERAIQGRGAFRRFEDAVYDLGLNKEWFEFRDNEYKRVAREWCEENGIECVE